MFFSPPPPPDDIPEDNEILEEINTPDFLHEEPIFMTNNPAPSMDYQDFSISSLNLRSITPIKTEDYKIGKYDHIFAAFFLQYATGAMEPNAQGCVFARSIF